MEGDGLMKQVSAMSKTEVTCSDEINIVVFKDKNRLNHLDLNRRCVRNSNGNHTSAPGEQVSSENDFIQHSKTNVEMLTCDHCSYEGTKSNLAVHRLRMHNKEHKCSKCEYQSVTVGGIERHMRIFHSTEDVRAYACGVCSYRGVTRKQLMEHTKFQHWEGVAKHPCPFCRKTFKTQVQMKHHVISHSRRRLYACKGCSYRAKHRQSLHFHIRHSHPGEDIKRLFKGPTDAEFEDMLEATSVLHESKMTQNNNAEESYCKNVEINNSPGDEEQLPTTSLLEGGGVENLLIFPLGNVMSLYKDAEASSTNEIVANSSEDGSPINSLCDASFNQILVHLLSTK